MSIHISRRTLTKSVAVVGLLAAASALSGCTTMGMGSGDPVVTGSTGYAGTSNLNQPMPGAIGGTTKVAEGPYMPPEDIGSGSQSGPPAQTYASLPPLSRPSSITSQDLPVIGNAPSNGNPRAMSAQPNFAPLPSATAPHIAAAAPNLSVVPGGLYTHVIRSGESLYTIAKHYGVTAQSIMQASNIPAPDKIFVGQRVSIPGRPDLLAAMDGGKPAPQPDKLPIDSGKPVLASAAPQPLHGPSTAPATRVASLGLAHWGSDARGVETTRRFLLEWLSYAHRYVPLGLLAERLPPGLDGAARMGLRCPPLVGRSGLETLLASPDPGDWVRISELVLGPAPPSLRFVPKHKSKTLYEVPRGAGGGGGGGGGGEEGEGEENG